MFILDTDVISNLSRRIPLLAIVEWLDRLPSHEVACSVVTVTEIQRGIERLRVSSAAGAEKAEDWLETLLVEGGLRILPLNVQAARLFGRMLETPALRHFIITDPQARDQATGADLAIAAIAITNGAVIATRNIRHFMQINACFPLPGLFDPAAQAWHVMAS